LSYDDEHHRIALIDLAGVRPDASEPGSGALSGVDHVAYTYATIYDLFENYAQLQEQGILPYWCVHHGVTMSMYYADPDGNQMELQVDACADAEAADAYMRGPHFETNPIGVEFDPDEILAKLRAGAPGAVFLTRTIDLPVSPIRGSIAA